MMQTLTEPTNRLDTMNSPETEKNGHEILAGKEPNLIENRLLMNRIKSMQQSESMKYLNRELQHRQDVVELLKVENIELQSIVKQIEMDKRELQNRVQTLQREYAKLLQTTEALNYRVNQLEIEQNELCATRETLLLLETEKGDIVKRLQAVELQARNEKESQNCLICYDQTRQLAFDPCGHVACCLQCANNISNKKCPICRKTIKRSLKIHIP